MCSLHEFEIKQGNNYNTLLLEIVIVQCYWLDGIINDVFRMAESLPTVVWKSKEKSWKYSETQ